MDLLNQKCEFLYRDKSDINEHLPTLYNLGRCSFTNII